MRAYRQAFVDEDGRRGLSQEGLLRRMSSVEGGASNRYSRATISRWESGSTLPSVERLRIFGETLQLSDMEVAGLILLAGLAPDYESAGAQVGIDFDDGLTSTGGGAAGFTRTAGEENTDAVPVEEHGGSPCRSLVSFVVFRILLTGVLTVGAGYALAALGWDGAWMPVAYLAAVVGLVMALGFMWPDRDAGLRDFFWVSLFFVLAVPSLQFAPLRMDHYGFYAMGDLSGTHLPYMLALLVSLALAGVSATMFQLLWRWQHSGDRVKDMVLRRAVRAVLPPLVVSYAVVVALSNSSVWIQSAAVFAVLAGVFVSLLLMRDPEVNPSQNQRRFLVNGSLVAAVSGTVVGMAVIVTVYASPDLPAILPDHNLFGSWKIDFDGLGYTRDEAMDRLNVAYMWHAMCLFVYMVFVVGGSYLLGIYRLAGGDGAGPDAAHSDALAMGVAEGRAADRRAYWSLVPRRVLVLPGGR